MKKIIWLVLAMVFVASYTVLAYSGENISNNITDGISKFETAKADEGWAVGFGPDKLWKIKPSFNTKVAFDSNVHREPGGQRDEDVIFSFMPAIDLERQGTRFGVKSGYKLDYQQYVKEDDESGFNHYWRNSAQYTSDKAFAKIRENLSWQKTYATSEQSERRTLFTNDIGTEVGYNLTDKTSVSGIYNNLVSAYKDSVLRDFSYVDNEFGGRIYYHATPKTDLYFQGAGNDVSYYNSDLYNSNGFSLLLGAVGKVTEKVVLSAETGNRYRNYDNDLINSYNNWIFQGAAKYYATSKVAVSLTAKRDIQESVYSDTGWYGVNRWELGFEYALRPNVKAQLGVGLQHNKYPKETTEGTETDKRSDWLVNTLARVNWTPYKFMSLSTGYAYQTRESNFGPFDYVDHVVDCTVSLRA